MKSNDTMTLIHSTWICKLYAVLLELGTFSFNKIISEYLSVVWGHWKTEICALRVMKIKHAANIVSFFPHGELYQISIY